MSAAGVPDEQHLRSWVRLALGDRAQTAELSVRVVDEAEITALNSRYRGKDYPTNVLSFPYEGMPGVDSALLGDVAAHKGVRRHFPTVAEAAGIPVYVIGGADIAAELDAKRAIDQGTRLAAVL